ncbi:MAG: RNA-binding protein [Rhodospirillaceae bacterium]|nr:RNA-binding protein [Rhodospirillaceae bacterium]
MPHADTLMRQCLASGAQQPTAGMIRFVVGPDDALVPDLEERLPGRGLWLSARRDLIETAIAKRLFSKAAHQSVSVPDGLSDRLAGLLKRRCLDILGLARRAGLVTFGADRVREALAQGRTGALVEAADGSPGERRKFVALAEGIAVVDVFTRAELGGALGRDDAVHVAIAAHRLAAAFVAEAARFAGVRATAPAH